MIAESQHAIVRSTAPGRNIPVTIVPTLARPEALPYAGTSGQKRPVQVTSAGFWPESPFPARASASPYMPSEESLDVASIFAATGRWARSKPALSDKFARSRALPPILEIGCHPALPPEEIKKVTTD